MRGKERNLNEKIHEAHINMYTLHINKANLDQLLHTSSPANTESVQKRKLFFLRLPSSSETEMI